MIRTKLFIKKPLENIIDKNIVITGIVKNITHIKNFDRVLIKTIDIFDENNRNNNKIDFRFNIYAYLSNNKKQFTKSGEKIILHGKLVLPSKKRNPGGFDEEKYFKIHEITYKIFPNKIENSGTKNYLFYFLEYIKNKMSFVYDSMFSKNYAGIIKAMVLGEKSDLDYYTSDLYKSAGIYHILAISGLHISIVALFFNKIFRFFLSSKISDIISVFLLILYCLMTGASISTVRAVIMASVIIFGKIIYRDGDLLNSLAFACLLICIFNPFCIFDVGFEYSFGSVFGIAIFNKSLNKILQKAIDLAANKYSIIKFLFKNKLMSEYVITCFSASLAASIVTYAVTVKYFYYFTPYSVLINLFILPTLSIFVVCAFAVGIIGLISIDLGVFFSGIVYILLKFYELVCKIFVYLPFSKILTGNVNNIFFILYFIWLFLLIYSFAKDYIKIKRYLLKFSIILLIAIISIKLFVKQDFEIVMLDVGQGDCFYVNCDNQTFIIDGGGKMTQDIDNNTGAKILMPFLDYKAKSNIDGAFVSHSDADHIIGIIELINQKNVKKIFLSAKIIDDNLTKELILAAKKHSVPIYYLKSGDYIEFSRVNLECLYPFKNTKPENNNDTSIVFRLNFKLKTGYMSILFTGDIEKNAEQEILNSNKDIQANILKLAHHGSKTSSSLEFIKRVNPKLAIASNGKNNNYGHPSQEVVKRLKDLNIPLINTSEHGAITLKFYDNQIKIISEVNP